MTELTFF